MGQVKHQIELVYNVDDGDTIDLPRYSLGIWIIACLHKDKLNKERYGIIFSWGMIIAVIFVFCLLIVWR